MHSAPVCTFFLKQKCERKHCKFSHPKTPQNKSGEKTEDEKNHSAAPKAKRVSEKSDEDENGNTNSFLEIFSKLQKRLDQRDQMFQERLDKMEKKMESNPVPQITGFPTMWPAGQTLQQRLI